MKITILTMFPQMLDGLRSSPLIQRAEKQNIVEIQITDIKDYADGSFRHIDDSPYGGSTGMILRPEPLVRALRSIKTESNQALSVLLSPKGRVYNQSIAKEYSKLDHLILVCGHYEGVDARFENYVDQQLSIGDYILSGGEYAAASIADTIIRLLDGTLKESVTEKESHEHSLLEERQYTHPFEFEGRTVPQILLSGNTKAIEEFNHRDSIEETKKYRPDMAKTYMINQIQKAEQSFIRYMAEPMTITDNIIKYTDTLLPDMYDHNYFEYKKSLTEDEYNFCIASIQTNYIKLQGPEPLSQDLVKKHNLEESKILTMALFNPQEANWTTNPNFIIKNYHKDRNAKDIFKIELDNYKEVYGEDFATRKVARYLKASDKNKKLNFLTACQKETPISTLYTWTDHDCVCIDGLVTTTEYRHQKAATTLLSQAIKNAPFAYLHADADDTPKDMYKAMGFEVVSTTWEYFKKI